MLPFRPLGQSGLSTAPIAFGGNVFGWSVDEATTFSLLDAFVEAGFNLIDTADVYSSWAPGNQGGESETLIGRWLHRSGKRDKVLIATKVAKWSRHPGLSPANLNAAIDDSLKRLQTDVVDLYFAHEDDPSIPQEETQGAFSELMAAGKIRTLGASNFSAARLHSALQVAHQHNLPRYEVMQPQYNLYDRASYETELEPLARQHGLGVITYYALASGFLSGKYRSAGDAAKSSARGAGVIARYLNPRGLKILAALDDIAAHHNARPAQVALAWLLARPGVSAPIVSATHLAQLHDLLAAARLSLSAQEMATLDAASRE